MSYHNSDPPTAPSRRIITAIAAT